MGIDNSSAASLQDFIKEINGSVVSGGSSYLESLQEFKDIAANNALSDADKYKALADSFYKEYGSYIDTAAKYKQRALDAGDLRTAELFQRIEQSFQQVANERLIQGDVSWAKKIASESSGALHELSGFTSGALDVFKRAGPVVDGMQMAAGWYDGVANGDWDSLGSASSSVAVSGILGLAASAVVGTFVAAGSIPFLVGAAIVGGFAYGGALLGEALWEWFGEDATAWFGELLDWAGSLDFDLSDEFLEFAFDLGDAINDIEDAVNDFFNMARNWIQRSDPLTLDLDGDGLETTGIDPTNPILFDHDGDGTANATGWVKPDDGYLVFDRNENGLIDNGTELFGDSTPLLDENVEVVGQAADGFAALAAEDTNGDGIVDANDANWDKLRVWQDLNSDGKTDEGELKTLEELGIAGFHVVKEENNQVLANGNAIADLGSYIKTDGSEGALGEVTGNMAGIDLADNPFYREFDDSIPLTEQAEALPNMQGSGHLRDLQEASSLSPELATAVEGYAQGTTKSQQLARLDSLIERWAATSSGETSIEKADDQGYDLNYMVPGLTRSMLKTQAGSRWSSGDDGGGSSIDPSRFGDEYQERRDALLAEQARVTKLVGLLEQFNGMTFVDIEPDGIRTGADQFIASSSNSSGPDGVSVRRVDSHRMVSCNESQFLGLC